MKNILPYILLIALSLSTVNCASDNNRKEDNNHLSMALTFKSDSTLHIKASYKVASLKSDEIYFLLNPEFEINSIKSEGLKNYELAMKKDRPFPFYKLSFDTKRKKTEALNVDFEYTIDLKALNHIKSNWIELNGDKLWYPNYNDIDNKFSWSVKIENLYKDYSIATYDFDGRIKYKTLMNPSSPILLEQKKPHFEIFLMMGKNMKLWHNKKINAKPSINIFVHEDMPTSLLFPIEKKLRDIIDFLNKKFGKSEKINKYLLVIRNTDPTEIRYWLSRGEILLADKESDTYAGLAHEIAHYWWSNADFIKEPWMNEAFANYSMFLVLEEFDKEALKRQLQRSERNSKNAVRIRDAGTFSGENSNTYYHKGSLLLWELEQEIGRPAMMQLLSARVENKINSTKGFLSLLEKQMGKQVRDDFEAKL